MRFLLEKEKDSYKVEQSKFRGITKWLHPKDVDFKCGQCDHVFTQKANLKRHTEYTHNYNNANFYKCDQCNVQYTSNGHLK